MKTPDPKPIRSGRQFAAWIGLTPKDHSTAGKVRLGVIQHAQRSGKASPWLAALLRRKSPKVAAVALANKIARIAWKLMRTGEAHTATSAAAVA